MLLSTSFLVILAAIERAIAVPEDILRRGPGAFSDPNTDLLWHTSPDPNFVPQPVRGTRGGTLLATGNAPVSQQSSDTLAPPFTDNGLIKNLKFSMANAVHGLFQGGYGQSLNSTFAV